MLANRLFHIHFFGYMPPEDWISHLVSVPATGVLQQMFDIDSKHPAISLHRRCELRQ